MARLKHRLEYAAFRAALAGNRVLSDAAAARVGAVLGRLGYPLGIRRAIVERNLRIAFPDMDREWVAAVARESYAHLGRETLMMLRLSSASPADVIERTVADEGSPAIRLYHEGRGLVVVAGHFGNWELGAAAWAARGYRVHAIAKRAANPLFYQHILEARARLGVSVIDLQAAPKKAMRALREGAAVAFAADQYTGRGGIRVPFFGVRTSMFRGPALMAVRTGAPIVICLPVRLPDARYDALLEPLDVTRTGDVEGDVARITAAWAARLEAAVREHPGQYLWHHRRWREAVPEREQDSTGAV